MSSKQSSTLTARNIPCAAPTGRALWRVWIRCTKEEEKVKFLTDLLCKGVGLPTDEEFIISEEKKRTASSMDKKGKANLIELLTQQKLDTRKIKNKLRTKLESEISGIAY